MMAESLLRPFSALIINDDEEALMNEGDSNSDELHANASTLNYKDLKGIMRASVGTR